MKSCIVLTFFCVFGFSAWSLPEYCKSAEAAKDQNLSCFTVLSSPSGAEISLRGSTTITNRSPATFCGLGRRRSYLLTVDKEGYEKRYAMIEIENSDSGLVVKGRQVKSVFKSVLIPGWGQASNNETGWGIWSFLSIAGAGVGAYFAYNEYADHRDNYYKYSNLANTAEKDYDKKVFYSKALEEDRLANTTRNHLLLALGVLGWEYVGNLAESFLASSPPRMLEAEKGTIKLGIPRRSLKRAFVRSMFFPGLGQQYKGHAIKGALFKALFLGAGLYAADSWKNYEESSDLYYLAKQNLEEAESLDQIESARSEMATRWDEMRKKEEARNASFIAVASIWTLNIVDVLTSRNEYETRSSFAIINLDRSGEIKTGIGIRF